MAKFLIQKSGPLSGEVEISGSKNAVLPILAATVLCSQPCTLEGVPALKDVDIMCSLIESLGVKVSRDIENSKVEIDAGTIESSEAPDYLVERMRASMVVMGPLLARTGKAKIHLPGGCAIGDRPVELHLKGLRALGAKISVIFEPASELNSRLNDEREFRFVEVPTEEGKQDAEDNKETSDNPETPLDDNNGF